MFNRVMICTCSSLKLNYLNKSPVKWRQWSPSQSLISDLVSSDDVGWWCVSIFCFPQQLFWDLMRLLQWCHCCRWRALHTREGLVVPVGTLLSLSVLRKTTSTRTQINFQSTQLCSGGLFSTRHDIRTTSQTN